MTVYFSKKEPRIWRGSFFSLTDKLLGIYINY